MIVIYQKVVKQLTAPRDNPGLFIIILWTQLANDAITPAAR